MTEPIDQATKKRIEKEAMKYIDQFNNIAPKSAYKAGYIAGASVWAERLKQERNKVIDECIELFPFNETNRLWQWQIKQKLRSLKDKKS